MRYGPRKAITAARPSRAGATVLHPTASLFSAEYQDWLEAGRTPAGLAWSKVKDEWKKFEAELEPK